MDNNVQEKKLRFNIIDFLIVCAVISLVMLFVFHSGIEKPVVQDTAVIEYSVKISGAEKEVLDFANVDDVIYDENGQNQIGKIISKKFTPFEVYTADADGKIVKMASVGLVDIYLTVEVEAVALDSGYETDNGFFVISGEKISFLSDGMMFDATVIDVDKK